MVKIPAVSVMKDTNGWIASEHYSLPILMSPSHLSCCWKLLTDRQSPFLFDLLGIFIFPWIASTNVPQATQRFQGLEQINWVISIINLCVIKFISLWQSLGLPLFCPLTIRATPGAAFHPECVFELGTVFQHWNRRVWTSAEASTFAPVIRGCTVVI